MFDIGFWELATIAIIGIVVVGPERLPEVVRTVAAYVRKARRAFQDVKSDIERELDLDDLRRQMHDVDMDDHIKKLNQSVMDAERDIRKVVSRFDADLPHGDNIDDLEDPEVRAADEHDPIAQRYSDDLSSPESEQYADTGIEGEPVQPSRDAGGSSEASNAPTQNKHE